jgi:hypothetical protein
MKLSLKNRSKPEHQKTKWGTYNGKEIRIIINVFTDTKLRRTFCTKSKQKPKSQIEKYNKSGIYQVNIYTAHYGAMDRLEEHSIPDTSHACKPYARTRVILTNFTQLNPSCRAASCASTQDIPSIIRNSKFYRVHNSHLLVPTLSQINPVHTTTPYLFKIHLNTCIIHPPTSWSYSSSLAFQLSHKNPICIRLLNPIHATCHAQLIFLDLIILIILGEEYKL